MRDTAIRNTHPTVVIINGDKDARNKDGDVVVLDESKIAPEITRLQAIYDSTQYQRDRQPAYPDIGDQLDDLYHAGMFSAEMAAKIKSVKDKFPKE
jgi:hypothetical protein